MADYVIIYGLGIISKIERLNNSSKNDMFRYTWLPNQDFQTLEFELRSRSQGKVANQSVAMEE